ncbi:hypothetical protein [Marinomonas sp. GJ51-6]|uniref:hypothetical protein n=1 Tax=Marinomonas sp. GJ51-6 TaxID=2992802 RepID=UPI002935023C|nr:hypothetical protein [Marinomonas sp. GJ51-6]WOD06075.1 hypothetical protein ONZ50_09985 [Marinomonas sp. GJ51-6]
MSNSASEKTKLSLSKNEIESLKVFLSGSTEYYVQAFNQIVQGKKYQFNAAAAILVPL